MNSLFNMSVINRISDLSTTSEDFISSMDQIVKLIRPNFIIDNVVMYKINHEVNDLEAIYARSLGRGRKAEADVSWGEIFAQEVIEKDTALIELPSEDKVNERLKRSYLLGLPIKIFNNLEGSIIFIRFGGPNFSEEEVEFAEFVTSQISVLFGHFILRDKFLQLKNRHQQMQLQEDFMSTISHELRSPLGFIKGYATTLLRSDTDWDKESELKFLTIIDKETDHLLELINNLLDSSRLQSGQIQMFFQPVQIDATIKDVITRTQMRDPDLDIKLVINNDLAPIIADPNRISQVIENIVGNATKYAPNSRIEIRVSQDTNRSKIEIKDYGPGIIEDHQPYIFDRFYRVKDNSCSVSGSGLGLYICREIINAHNGTINVSSKRTKGTTFQVVLPNTQKS